MYKSGASVDIWACGQPWYQGAAESLIKGIKKCFKFSMGEQRLSAVEFTTVCYEAANMLNERPLGTLPGDDADINLLTPNSLLLGRALGDNLTGLKIGNESLKTRLDIVSLVSQRFWEKWTELYAPIMMTQSKWCRQSRNLRVGDVVVVCDSNVLRSNYYIAMIKEVFPDKKGVVRKVLLRYKSYKIGDHQNKYVGGSDIVITRSVHRLALLVPVED